MLIFEEQEKLCLFERGFNSLELDKVNAFIVYIREQFAKSSESKANLHLFFI